MRRDFIPTEFIIECTEADMDISVPPPPSFARDGSCAHATADPMGRCRRCSVEMDEAAYAHQHEAWEESL
jgi:hypothetical protein